MSDQKEMEMTGSDEQPTSVEFYFTLGMKYGYHPEDAVHPLGLHHDEYAVIEAPDELTARAIFIAACGGKNEWAMTYTGHEWTMRDREKYAPRGCGLRISWMNREDVQRTETLITEAIFGEVGYDPLAGFPSIRPGQEGNC